MPSTVHVGEESRETASLGHSSPRGCDNFRGKNLPVADIGHKFAVDHAIRIAFDPGHLIATKVLSRLRPSGPSCFCLADHLHAKRCARERLREVLLCLGQATSRLQVRSEFRSPKRLYVNSRFKIQRRPLDDAFNCGTLVC